MKSKNENEVVSLGRNLFLTFEGVRVKCLPEERGFMTLFHWIKSSIVHGCLLFFQSSDLMFLSVTALVLEVNSEPQKDHRTFQIPQSEFSFSLGLSDRSGPQSYDKQNHNPHIPVSPLNHLCSPTTFTQYSQNKGPSAFLPQAHSFFLYPFHRFTILTVDLVTKGSPSPVSLFYARFLQPIIGLIDT